MTRAILICFHKYTPFGAEFYEPFLDFQIDTLRKYRDEYDKVYFIDSNWEINPDKLDGLNAEIVKVSPHLRYYDAYKEVIPQVKEELVLFMDDDFLVYRKYDVIARAFMCISDFLDLDLEPNEMKRDYDVCTIMDTIGEYKTDKLKLGNKFCPYFFATKTELLKKYLNIEWGPDMPYCETLGHLTEAMLKDNIKVYEMEDDKNSLLFDETKTYEKDHKKNGKGYYHIRAGSVPAYLLATKKYGNKKTYQEYIENQPKSEILRQLAWYDWLSNDNQNAYQGVYDILSDLKINYNVNWITFMKEFEKYHNLF